MIIRIGEKKYPTESCINLFVAGLLLLPLYIDLFAALSEVVGFSTTVTTSIYYISLWALLLLAIPTIVKALNKNVIIAGAFVVGGLLLHYSVYSDSGEYIWGSDPMAIFTFSPQTLLAAVPYMLIGLAVTDMRKLGDILHSVARIGIVFGALSYIVTISAGLELQYDDMNQAYAVCVMNCILITGYRKYDAFFLIAGVLSNVLAGTRGAIVALLVAILLKLVLLQTNKRKKALGVTGSAAAIILMNTKLPEIILGGVSDLFAAFGVAELRLVDYARDGLLMDTAGRDDIMRTLMDKVWENPVFGYGLGADRSFTKNEMYAHNMVVEMWIAFGLVLGTVIVAWMGYRLFKAMTKTEKTTCMLIAGLFSSVVIKLLFSSSFIYSKELFLLLGLCLATATEKTTNSDITHEDIK